jgi:hypothetical protein
VPTSPKKILGLRNGGGGLTKEYSLVQKEIDSLNEKELSVLQHLVSIVKERKII